MIIKYSFYLLFFLVPLILTPFNYELFEFNKMLTVYFLTVVIVASWLAKMISQKKIICQRTPLDIPLCLYLFSQILATVFSIDRHTSWWGYYSRFNSGLLSTICYFLLYYAFVANMSQAATRRALRVTLISASLVAGYGIAEHYGIDAKYWVQDVQNRVFSTLGQPNWLAAYLVALIPLTWAFVSPLFYILNSIFYICLLFTKSRSGFFGFGGAFLAFWSTRPKALFKPFLLLTLPLLIFSLIIGTPWTPSIKNLTHETKPAVQLSTPAEAAPLLISESGDIRKVVWHGAVEIWKHYPILGTGPETFAYSYYWFRPREHNDLSEWDFLYNKAHNEYLNLAATSGTVGLVSLLVLIGWFLFFGLKHLSSPLICGLLAGYISILVTNFFGFAVVAVSLLFFLFPAMAVVLTQKKPTEIKIKKASLKPACKFAISLVFLLGLFLLLKIGQYWSADSLFARAEKFSETGQDDLAFNNLQIAINRWPQEPIYHNELAWASANLAVAAYLKKDATLSSQLAKLAIDESDKSLKISPYHLNYWKNRTKVFHQLTQIDEKYYQPAIEALLRAAELAPTDPKIRYNLALFLLSVNQIETATKNLEVAVDLKPNYEDARFALALFYEQQDRKTDARQQLEYILENINPQSEKAKEKLK